MTLYSVPYDTNYIFVWTGRKNDAIFEGLLISNVLAYLN